MSAALTLPLLLLIPSVEMDYSHVPKRPQITASLAGECQSLIHCAHLQTPDDEYLFILMIYLYPATFAGFILGTNLGWSSPVESQLQQNSSLNIIGDEYNSSIWYVKLNDAQMSWVGSLVNVGALFGSLSGGFLMDYFGRRITLMSISAPLFLIGWLLIAFAINPCTWFVYTVAILSSSR